MIMTKKTRITRPTRRKSQILEGHKNVGVNILFREGNLLGARYVSGNIVVDEEFRDGRLMVRYWNPNGQVWPEMHLSQRRWDADQPADTFLLSINGCDTAGGFVWKSAYVEPDPSFYRPRRGPDGKPMPVTHGVICLKHREMNIDVKVHTRLDGSPFLIRWLEITNLNKQAIGIMAVAPLGGLLWAHRYEEHLPAGYDSPFELAYNHMFEWGHEGDFWFEPMTAGQKTVNGEKKGRSGWGRPAFWARNVCNGQTFVCELAWGGNYEFALDCRFEPVGRNAELFFRMGLTGYDQVLRVLDPGESVVTPAVHMALFQDNIDTIVQATHEHVRHVVMPEQIFGRHVEIEANHRGYLCDRENVTDILKDVDVAAAIGAEMYVIDAGWYGNEPNQWWNNTGDWVDGPWMAKGGGLKAVVDHVHKLGMKFGLWVEIEAAGANSTLKKEHPNWLLKRDSKPIANSRALDLTNLEVASWEESEIERLIRAYELDMYRIDHNHCLQPPGNRPYHGFVEDLTWRYYDAFYAMFDRLRRRFPKVVFQNCAGGGGRLDWGTMARFHNTELSDWMRMPRGLKILNGVTMSLPPEILLRTFGTETSEHVLDGNVDTQLRLCLCRIIFRGIAPSVDDLTPYLRGRIEHYLGLYKSFIRPVMIEGRVFHHTSFLPLAESTPWCVLEYDKADHSAAVAGIFRTGDAVKDEHPDEYIFRPHGLDLSCEYEVTLDNSGMKFRGSGATLSREGVRIRLEQPQTSELILYREISSCAGARGKREI